MASADCFGGLSPEQLEMRKGGVGASESPKLVGLSPYGSPLSVYLDKVGLGDRVETPQTEWGHRLEEVVILAFAETTGFAVRPSPGTLAHPVHPWLLATPDAMLVGPAPLDAKTSRTSEGWGDSGTDQARSDYVVQSHQQMLVTGADVGYIAVLIGGSDFRWYEIPRSEALCGILLDVVRRFWEMVMDRRPPDPDWTDPRTPELVQMLHRPAAGKEVALGAKAILLADDYGLLGRHLSELEKQRAEAKARLAEMMGDAEFGLLLDGRVVRRQVQHVAAEEAPRKAFDKTVFSIRPPKKKR